MHFNRISSTLKSTRRIYDPTGNKEASKWVWERVKPLSVLLIASLVRNWAVEWKTQLRVSLPNERELLLLLLLSPLGIAGLADCGNRQRCKRRKKKRKPDFNVKLIRVIMENVKTRVQSRWGWSDAPDSRQTRNSRNALTTSGRSLGIWSRIVV